MSHPGQPLGQHWLKDQHYLDQVIDSANLNTEDNVVEIGPGQGDLTAKIAKKVKSVTAVELDQDLAKKLPGQVASNVDVVNQNFLDFDLSTLPSGYKVVANIPYYISGEIIKKLLSAENMPSMIVILVQKEVAERAAAGAGGMSLLGLSVQLKAEVATGVIVPAEAFSPPPKVDSMVLTVKPKSGKLNYDAEEIIRFSKPGFNLKRKKLSNSYKADQKALAALKNMNFLDKRPQDLSVEDWTKLYKEQKSV